MFHLLQQVGSSLRGNSADRLVREVAEQSLTSVRDRLSVTAGSMGAAELRGYVRARAVNPVRTHARQILRRHRIPGSWLDELVSRSLERTTHLVVGEFMVQPIVNVPAAHVRLRAAA